MTDLRVDKWKRWLEKAIQNDVYSMHLQRFAWKRMMEVATTNPDLKGIESYFWDFQFDIYIKVQAGAVRRQADVNTQAASLGQLVSEIADTPSLVTRDWYLDHWGDDDDETEREYWRNVGAGEWDKKFAGETGDHFDPAIARADLAELRDESEKIRHYVDKYVAHSDASVIRKGTSADAQMDDRLPTLTEVHNGIDLVGRQFRKYKGLFSSADILDLTPVMQHDWEAVFRIQWLPDVELPRETREYEEQRLREGVDLDAD